MSLRSVALFGDLVQRGPGSGGGSVRKQGRWAPQVLKPVFTTHSRQLFNLLNFILLICK